MIDDVMLEAKSINAWLDEASLKPMPRMLFSEFWYEGEVCILFADTNVGKSILAMQIAESISSGQPIPNFKLETEAQKVLLIDFELSDMQLRLRYGGHKFSPNLYRSQISENYLGGLGDKTVLMEIERYVKTGGVKVIIIDNLTYLIEDFEKAKFASELMKELKRLKNNYSLSILLLAHTPKKDFSKPITINEMQGSKMLGNFCDSAFTIGRCYNDDKLRYIKQIKQRNCEQLYGKENVVVCEIKKDGKNKPLRFIYVQFDDEDFYLNKSTLDFDKELSILKAKQMKAEGLSYRTIGKELGVSEGAIRKWLKK